MIKTVVRLTGVDGSVWKVNDAGVMVEHNSQLSLKKISTEENTRLIVTNEIGCHAK